MQKPKLVVNWIVKIDIYIPVICEMRIYVVWEMRIRSS